jgi:hypothetical protein
VAAIAERVRARREAPVMAVTSLRQLRGSDHLDVGNRERVAGIENETTRR